MRSLVATAAMALIVGCALVDCASADKKASGTERELPARKVSAPGQPARGPGSSDYVHAEVNKILRDRGADGYWLFLPADPVPERAPVVLFLHGTRAMNPYDYGGWIEHLVRRGNVVIYPIFESAGLWDAKREGNIVQMERAMAAAKEAIRDIQKTTSIDLDLGRFAITGHSFGGGLTGQVAARAVGAGLPEPRAAMPVQPGWKGKEEMPMGVLSKIPPTTLFLVVEGDTDQFEESRKGLEMVKAATAVPWDRKAFVRMFSDERSGVKLISDHAAPLAPREDYGEPITGKKKRRRAMAAALTGMRDGEADALDYLGYWRLFDALCEAAFKGEGIESVVGSGKQLSVGTWSDGTPIRSMEVIRNP